MHTIVAAALRVGDVIYARGHEQQITRIQHATPRDGQVSISTTEGDLPPVGGNQKVSVIRLTSK